MKLNEIAKNICKNSHKIGDILRVISIGGGKQQCFLYKITNILPNGFKTIPICENGNLFSSPGHREIKAYWRCFRANKEDYEHLNLDAHKGIC